MNRALPATYVDLARDGVPAAKLKAKGDQAVWLELRRIADSALLRGWAYFEWADLILSPRSVIGRQVALKNGKKERSKAQIDATLRSVWASAEKFVANAPAPITREDVEAKAKLVIDYCADADNGLLDSDRRVLAFAAQESLRRGTDRPTLPVRDVAEAAGLSVGGAHLVLKRLDASGLLRLEIRGTAGGPATRKRRASAYRLGDVQAVTASTTAPVTTTETEGDDMARITIDMNSLTPEQRDMIRDALGLSDPKGQDEPGDVAAHDNVVPIRLRSTG